jgi:hypothetical protein
MGFVDDDSESISINWGIDLEFLFLVVGVSWQLTSWEPFSTLVIVPGASIILGELDLNCLDSSCFAAASSLL